MNNLNNAIALYQDERIKKLKIEYKLSDDRKEKQALKVQIILLKLNNK